VALASFTSWPLSELLEMDGGELLEWLEACRNLAK
jgi:hypothetical protein